MKELLYKKQSILAKQNPKISMDCPYRMLLMGYKSTLKPFPLRASADIHFIINNRARILRLDIIMQSALDKFKLKNQL